MSCTVCTETYTKCTRKKTTCPFCEYDVCRECLERYILSKTEPSCMNCGKVWNRFTLVRNCSTSFLEKTFKRHRENILFDIERSLMPSTQEQAQHILEARKYIAEMKQNMTQIHMLKGDMIRPERSADEMRYNNTIRLRIFAIELENRVLEALSTRQQSQTSDETRVRREFIHACPTEGCKGFLSTQWKCGLCNKYTCKDCHCTKEGADHVCNPDTVASIQMLKSDKSMKPCPKCGISISKIEGCDQMFCTICNIAFSWRTGELSTGTIHNPHYFEYLRSIGRDTRNLEDIGCGGLPHLGYRTPPEVLIIYERAAEFQRYKLPRYAQFVTQNVNGYTDLRIAYMINDIDEKTFKLKLQQYDKMRQKSTDIAQAMSTYIQIVSDILRRHQTQKTLGNPECLDELKGAMKYINSILSDVSKTYNCVVPVIEPTRINSLKY